MRVGVFVHAYEREGEREKRTEREIKK